MRGSGGGGGSSGNPGPMATAVPSGDVTASGSALTNLVAVRDTEGAVSATKFSALFDGDYTIEARYRQTGSSPCQIGFVFYDASDTPITPSAYNNAGVVGGVGYGCVVASERLPAGGYCKVVADGGGTLVAAETKFTWRRTR